MMSGLRSEKSSSKMSASGVSTIQDPPHTPCVELHPAGDIVAHQEFSPCCQLVSSIRCGGPRHHRAVGPRTTLRLSCRRRVSVVEHLPTTKPMTKHKSNAAIIGATTW